jgi:hypothetical protein
MLPRINSVNPPRPRRPATMRSAFSCSGVSMITAAGSPRTLRIRCFRIGVEERSAPLGNQLAFRLAPRIELFLGDDRKGVCAAGCRGPKGRLGGWTATTSAPSAPARSVAHVSARAAPSEPSIPTTIRWRVNTAGSHTPDGRPRSGGHRANRVADDLWPERAGTAHRQHRERDAGSAPGEAPCLSRARACSDRRGGARHPRG